VAKSKQIKLPIMDRLIIIQEKYDHLIPRELDVYEESGIS
jgi:hypothetical protein